MPISELCKYEVRDEIQHYEREGLSRVDACKKLAELLTEKMREQIDPEPLRQKAYYADRVENSTKPPTPSTSSQSTRNQTNQTKAKDGTHRGGSRPGAGRKPYKLKRTLGDTGHPGDPIVAEYEATIKGLNEKLTLVRESKDKQIQELREENQHLQAENSAFRLELKELKESAPPPPSVNGLHLKLEKLEAENERLQGELATAMELATAPQIAAF